MALEKYVTPALTEVVVVVFVKLLHSPCHLLSVVLCRILAVCHGVMYKQLAAWMLHGLLLDQNEEFFVKQGPSAGGAAASQEEEEEDLGLGGLSGKQLRELQDLVRIPTGCGLERSGGGS